MPKRTISISDTSERTIEANVLADIVHYIGGKYRRTVTIVSPTQNQEVVFGFDATFEGLPPGRTVYLQFKRPYSYSSKKHANLARFYLDTRQQQALMSNFNRREAYYVFVPLPKVREVVANRTRLLQIGVALDVYDVPNARKTTQKSRTVKVTKSALAPSVQVADPRIYDSANAYTLSSVCDQIGSDEATSGIRRIGERGESRRVRLEFVPRRSYFLHVSEERGG